MTEPVNHLPGDETPATPMPTEGDLGEQQLYDQEAEPEPALEAHDLDDEGGDPEDDRGPEDYPSDSPRINVQVGNLEDLLDFLVEKVAEGAPARFTKPVFEDVAASLISEEDYDGVLKALEEAYQSGRDSILKQAKPIEDLETEDPIAVRLNEVGAVALVSPCRHPGHEEIQWVNGPLEVIVDVARSAIEGDRGGMTEKVEQETGIDVELGQIESAADFQIADSTVTINVHNHYSS